MNAKRRKFVQMCIEKINHVCAKMEELCEDLDSLREEEYDSYASYPENLQESEKATACLDNSEKFEEIYDSFEDWIGEINEYLESLNEM